jgi:hypothetical protein
MTMSLLWWLLLQLVLKSQNNQSASSLAIPPMAYQHQTNAWFDIEVTIYWINTVLWSWHLSQHVHCLLLLDNCPAHTYLDESKLPMKLIIKFSPLNCTLFLQPADQGMIACLKVGYKANMLRSLLAICNDKSLYEEALAAEARARRGCKGLAYCSKAHLLDAMKILIVSMQRQSPSNVAGEKRAS